VVQRCSGHLRFYPNGDIAGFDIPTALGVTQALGYRERTVMLLLESADSGLKEAVQKHGNHDPATVDPDRGY